MRLLEANSLHLCRTPATLPRRKRISGEAGGSIKRRVSLSRIENLTGANLVFRKPTYDANAFCEWLSRKDNRTYRLPTEAEWEYACRGGSTTRYWNGNDQEELVRIANVADGAAKPKLSGAITIKNEDGFVFTAPVGSFLANPYGLHDVHGNVWEWCADWYDSNYYQSSPAANPQGPTRGTSWSYGADFLRSSSRGFNTPNNRSHSLGFRLVLE